MCLFTALSYYCIYSPSWESRFNCWNQVIQKDSGQIIVHKTQAHFQIPFVRSPIHWTTSSLQCKCHILTFYSPLSSVFLDKCRLPFFPEVFGKSPKTKRLPQSTTSGKSTFQGTNTFTHEGSVTYISPLHAPFTMALAHSDADPIGSLPRLAWIAKYHS